MELFLRRLVIYQFVVSRYKEGDCVKMKCTSKVRKKSFGVHFTFKIMYSIEYDYKFDYW